MNSFLDSLVSRHTGSISVVQPRLRGVFEQTQDTSNPFNNDTTFDLENKRKDTFNEINEDYSIIREQPFSAANKDYDFQDSTKSARMPLDVQNPVNQSFQKQPFIVPNVKPLTTNGADDIVKINSNEAVNALKTPMQQESVNAIFRQEEPIDSIIKPVLPVVEPIYSVVKPILPVVKPVLSATEILPNRQNVVPMRGSESSWLRDIKKASEPYFEPPPTPVIKVTIGRIEVRAMPTTSSPQRPPSAAPKPQMSLEDYLKKRNDNSK